MSYMRGDWYVWSDGDCTHLWARRPEDDVTGWASACGFAAGVAVPDDVLDEFAVMRVAELEQAGRLNEVEQRAVARHSGNGGCEALAAKLKYAEKIDGW